MRTVFITGAGSGFGAALTRRLRASGDRVVATDESLDGWAEQHAGADNVLTVPLDVRSPAAVERAVAEALAWSPVDVLVNNAGFAVFGTQEEADLEAVRDLFDVNVLGPARTTRALLPSLRARRGQVVQLSSVAGGTVFPESGFYAATKHALEAMSEALVQEVAPFGVRVHVIEPGAFATGFQARAARKSRPPAADSPYAEARGRWMAARAAVLEPPQDPEAVVDAIVAGFGDPAPFRRSVVGADAARILALRAALGQDAWTRLAADRNGFVGPHGAADVPGPDEVASLADDDPRLALALAALRLGHLDHFEATEEGRAALSILRARG